MRSKRHYCDGHEYRYSENDKATEGKVHNNYGTLTAIIEKSICGEYFNIYGTEASSDIIQGEYWSAHENSESVDTFEKRAETFIGFAALWEGNRMTQ